MCEEHGPGPTDGHINNIKPHSSPYPALTTLTLTDQHPTALGPGAGITDINPHCSQGPGAGFNNINPPSLRAQERALTTLTLLPQGPGAGFNNINPHSTFGRKGGLFAHHLSLFLWEKRRPLCASYLSYSTHSTVHSVAHRGIPQGVTGRHTGRDTYQGG